MCRTTDYIMSVLIAQSVEQWTFNPCVVGSIPTGRTNSFLQCRFTYAVSNALRGLRTVGESLTSVDV